MEKRTYVSARVIALVRLILAGLPLGTAPLQHGVFTAGTGFGQPNGLSADVAREPDRLRLEQHLPFSGARRITPKLDVFDAFNSDVYTVVASTQYNATSYLQPSVVLQGRIIRVGVDVKS